MSSHKSTTTRLGLIATTLILVCVAVLGMSAWPLRSGRVSAQEGEKVIKQVTTPDDPLKIDAVKSKKREITLSEKFSADGEWLRGLTVTFKNDSDKDVSHVSAALLFKHDDGSPLYTFYLTFGPSPFSAQDYAKRDRSKVYKRKQSFDLVLSDEKFSHIKAVLTSLGYPNGTKEVEIWINEVGFDDGDAWHGGKMFRRSLGNPEQLEPIGRAGERGGSPFYIKASWGGASAPLQSNCGEAGFPYWTNDCPVTGCELRHEPVYTHPTIRNREPYYSPRDCMRFDQAQNAYVLCAELPPPTALQNRPCSPTPTPTPTPGNPTCTDSECAPMTCVNGHCSWSCPVVIDAEGDGFDLTDKPNGVDFDINGDGSRDRTAWTSLGEDDGWLVLDRNGNGMIDNGGELFGNYSPQPDPPQGFKRNGFNALAEYDKPANGGNGNDRLDGGDSVFSSLMLWQDVNHNGISEPNELKSLPTLGVARIDLDYKRSRRVDEHGNQFKYRAKVKDSRGFQVGRWAWDVFFGGGS